MHETFVPFAPDRVRLLPSAFSARFELNRRYLLSLTNDNLLQSFYHEAGLWQPSQKPEGIHWGWESPTSMVRGHFLGHWLSAAARVVAGADDGELRAKAQKIVAELGRCQRENGGEWAGSIPSQYLDWIARGKWVWAPHYTLHKTLMGLYDMYAWAGSAQALDILQSWARWFHRWTSHFSRREMDDILDWETGGMLEVWANLYGVTGRQEHLDLLQRYDRPRFFNRLLAGEDALTNMHANTTVPEVQGAARAWEVTGDPRWRQIVEAYWRMAVTERGYYATGGQTCGEIWTPPGELAARLGDKNQEHCVVYNMMRLADYLLRWTGDITHAGYWERNLYNGILAQQHPQTGQISYFLPLEAGAVKRWGTPTETFWCCHGSLVQAHSLHGSGIYYVEKGRLPGWQSTAEDELDKLAVCQYVPSELTWMRDGVTIQVQQTIDPQTGATRRPQAWVVDLSVTCSQPSEFVVKLRLPWWVRGQARLTSADGQSFPVGTGGTWCTVRRTWQGRETLRLELPKGLTTCALPDQPDTVAFLDGPVVLAGLCAEERALHGDVTHPEALLTPDNEREWGNWRPGYRAVGQERGLRFLPLYEITDERYTVYFPVRPS